MIGSSTVGGNGVLGFTEFYWVSGDREEPVPSFTEFYRVFMEQMETIGGFMGKMFG